MFKVKKCLNKMLYMIVLSLTTLDSVISVKKSIILKNFWKSVNIK